MSIRIIGGWLNGRLIRRARKMRRCDYWRRNMIEPDPAFSRGRCTNFIRPGDYYAMGTPNERAGGFDHDRYCLECAGEEARATAGNITDARR